MFAKLAIVASLSPSTVVSLGYHPAILTATLMNVKELESWQLVSDYITGKYLSFTAREH
jgi:hypothetical protein